MSPTTPAVETATLGGGCFWCTEAVFTQLKGVVRVRPGYMGGHLPNPDYRAICQGNTGHAEVIQIEFDSNTIPYEEILLWFWKSHDPTTLNRQGNDKGTQYRSVIFYHSDEQKRLAEESIESVNQAAVFPDPLVTEVAEAATFYEAEPYHHDYYKNNPNQGYCQVIINPKLQKLGLETR